MSDAQQQPGLVSGHAQYAKGAAVETIGQAVGSEDWRKSGAEQKAAGIEEMKEAGTSQQNQAGEQQQQGYVAKAEELAGKAVGCEGMENQGKQG